MNDERAFRGIWIPAAVWMDGRLTALEKCILCEIDSLDGSDRGCYASNEHLASFCGCGVTKISTAITKLCELGYITSESFDGRTRVLKSCLSENVSLPFKKCKADLQRMKESNMESNLNSVSVQKSRFTPPETAEVEAYIREKGYRVNAERFVSYYESNGWRVGRNPMKDWRAAVRMWASNEEKTEAKPGTVRRIAGGTAGE